MFTLVTACMNREAHLRQNLPQWLRLPQLAEIVVVDWSNGTSLAELRALDPRINVVRVEQEPHWILSYAYNIGVVQAKQPVIVKCDADCLPDARIAECLPAPGYFFAGHWRTGTAAGKPSVNGQCVFLKAQFDAINGYSEIIRTYGRDDEDFYDRLIAAGHERREITPEWLNFLHHTQVDRIINQPKDVGTAGTAETFFREPGFKEMRNYFLARALPWSREQPRAAYERVHAEDRLTILRRDRAREIVISSDVEAAARLGALRHFAANMARLSEAAVARLDERACLAVIVARLKSPRAA